MKCVNPKCGKTIERPLELYDGRWACPYCRSIVGDVVGEGFRITAENEMLFTQSEICFLTWLTAGRDGRRDRHMLENAVELCREAALAGHPRAAMRMGYYYDKDFVEENRSETARCRVAYTYYASVCFNGGSSVDAEPGVTAPDWNKLRIEAAKLLLGMLSATPADFDAIDTYSFARNKAKAESMFGNQFGAIKRAAGQSESDRVKEVHDMLASCAGKGRIPVFGVYSLDGDSLKAVVRHGGGDFYRLVERRKVRVGIFVANGDRLGAADRIQMLTNRRLVEATLEQLGGEKVYMYFFALRKQPSVMDALEARGGELLRELINGGRKPSYVFYDDDLVYAGAKGGSSVKKAVKNLINEAAEAEA